MPDTPYVSVATLRADTKLGLDVDQWSDDELSGYVSEFEEIAETYRGVAFTTRTVTDESFFIEGTYYAFGDVYSSGYYGTGRITRQSIQLAHCKIQDVSSLTIDGVAVDLTTITTDEPTGTIYYPLGFAPQATILVSYTHGFSAPPQRCIRACKQYVRSVARQDAQKVSRDIVYQSDQGVTTRYSAPDAANGKPTGYTEVDRLLNSLPDFRAPGLG